MRKVMISLMAMVLSGAFATAMQAQRPGRPAQRPEMGRMDGGRHKIGDKMGKPAEGKGQHTSEMKGRQAQDGGHHKGKGMRPGGGQRPAGGGMQGGKGHTARQ